MQPPNQRKSPATYFVVTERVSNKQLFMHYDVLIVLAGNEIHAIIHSLFNSAGSAMSVSS